MICLASISVLSRDRSPGSGPGVGCLFCSSKKQVESSMAGFDRSQRKVKSLVPVDPKVSQDLVVSPMSDKNNMCIIVLKDKR